MPCKSYSTNVGPIDVPSPLLSSSASISDKISFLAAVVSGGAASVGKHTIVETVNKITTPYPNIL